ncbi:MAG TPA: HAMP domain-containing sensor histidine kinase [Myxococcota bacterium]|nr:HAMP domain-containing sensor histidine kinase [Myxococcota bacterium]HRY96732.1 HAMP domain-containing sensor histidine kinase [Myxococcota bacterium]HSA22406.1 HAMP domain-containing sensor histidine kinase [Myxococcota bacterium]
MRGTADKRGPRPIRPLARLWQLQLAHALLVGGLVGLWAALVPAAVRMPADLAARVRGYSLVAATLLLVVWAFNALFLGPTLRGWDDLVAGRLPDARAARLRARLVRYPYHSFILILLLLSAAASLIAVLRSAALPTPTALVVEIYILSLAFALTYALLAFLVGRWVLEPLLLAAGGAEVTRPWEPDLRKRWVLAAAATAAVAWCLAGVAAFDHLRRLALEVGPEAALQPEVVSGALALAVGGPLFVVLVGGLAALAMGTLRRELGVLASGLGAMADAPGAEPARRLPVRSLDEIGELGAATNRLAGRVEALHRVLGERAAEARQAEARQADLLLAVSHDLRTPLHSILGFGELLLESSAPGEALLEGQREDVHAVVRAAHHLLGLVDELVDQTRLDSGQMALALSAVDPARVVREALVAVTGLARSYEAELVAELPPALPPLQADETRLRQVLINLLGNALKYSRGARVDVSLRSLDEGGVEVRVGDRGPGLPADGLARLFGEFEQLHSGLTDPERRGSGLGLAIARRIVELHGGSIGATNREGGGAEFWFRLPAQRAREAGA